MVNQQNLEHSTSLDTITLGAGCFWCVEAVYQNVKGIKSVVSGYMGGKTENPSYKEICTGTTGHAEVCQLIYDKNEISFEEVLEVFFGTHDPTQLNRQGNDIGTQYRSAIFYHSENQKSIAHSIIQQLEKEKVYSLPIVTEITPAAKFHKAEDYHQNYFNLNGSQAYCQFVVRPKVEKLKKVFPEKLKK
jgi:peptide-methionine (S)-S-oxide reductase